MDRSSENLTDEADGEEDPCRLTREGDTDLGKKEVAFLVEKLDVEEAKADEEEEE